MQYDLQYEAHELFSMSAEYIVYVCSTALGESLLRMSILSHPRVISGMFQMSYLKER